MAPRTETCRPCVVSSEHHPDTEIPGLILDINPHGMLIRLMETLPVGEHVVIQMMRDDKFQRKLSTPHKGEIRRVESTVDGFYDFGIQLEPEEIQKADSRPVHIAKKQRTHSVCKHIAACRQWISLLTARKVSADDKQKEVTCPNHVY